MDMRYFCVFQKWSIFLLWMFFQIMPFHARAVEPGWSVGGYAGQYYNTEPAGFSQGNAPYLDQYIVALTASKTIWQAESLPLALDMDGMIGHQAGVATLDEVAFAPVVSWSGFPWNRYLLTDFRFGPLGLSYTTQVSPLERGVDGNGSQFLNFLVIELGFALPQASARELFLRLHHRCSIYDLLNNYGANGEDFFAIGYRYHF